MCPGRRHSGADAQAQVAETVSALLSSQTSPGAAYPVDRSRGGSTSSYLMDSSSGKIPLLVELQQQVCSWYWSLFVVATSHWFRQY